MKKRRKRFFLIAVTLWAILATTGIVLLLLISPTLYTPRNFNSYEELENWLEKDKTDLTFYTEYEYECGQFVLDLQKAALQDKRILSAQFFQRAGEAHSCCAAIIGGTIYFIEPQTDEIFYMGGIKW